MMEARLLPMEGIPEETPKTKEITVFCKQLNRIMDEKKIQPRDLVRRGIKSSTLCEWYKGTATPLADDNLLNLAMALNCTVDYLVYGIESNMPKDIQEMLSVISPDSKRWEEIRKLLKSIHRPILRDVSNGN